MSTNKFFAIGALLALMVLPFLGGCASQPVCTSAPVPNWNWSSNKQNWTYAPGARITNVVTPSASQPVPQQWPSCPTNWGGNFNFTPQCIQPAPCQQYQPACPQYQSACPQYQPQCQPVCPPPQYIPVPPMPILPIPPSYNYNCR